MISYINGIFKPFDECSIPVSDLGFQRAYGVFDFFRAIDNQIIWKDDYFDRLFNSIRAANLEINLTRQKLEELCLSLQSKNDVIHTPKDKILKGITRRNVLKLSSKGFDFQERDIFYDELYTFDEIFITGTSKFIVPIVNINGKIIGNGNPGIITKKLMVAFSNL